MNLTISSIRGVREWEGKYGSMRSIDLMFTDGSQGEVTTKPDTVDRRRAELEAIVGQPGDFQVEGKGDYDGRKQWKVLNYPGKPGAGGPGGGGAGPPRPRSTVTEAQIIAQTAYKCAASVLQGSGDVNVDIHGLAQSIAVNIVFLAVQVQAHLDSGSGAVGQAAGSGSAPLLSSDPERAPGPEQTPVGSQPASSTDVAGPSAGPDGDYTLGSGYRQRYARAVQAFAAHLEMSEEEAKRQYIYPYIGLHGWDRHALTQEQADELSAALEKKVR